MSGIYIKGLRMPSGCRHCLCNNDSLCMLNPESGYDETNGSERRLDCPLIYIEDHGDLIDRNKLLDPVGSYCPVMWTYEYGMVVCFENIKNAPVVIWEDKEDHSETS